MLLAVLVTLRFFFVVGPNQVVGRHHKQNNDGLRSLSIDPVAGTELVPSKDNQTEHEHELEISLLREQFKGSKAVEHRAIEIKAGQAHFVNAHGSGALVKGVLLYGLISVDSHGDLQLLMKVSRGQPVLPTESLLATEAFFKHIDHHELKIYEPKKVASRAVAEETGHRLTLSLTLDEVNTALETGVRKQGYANYVQAAQGLFGKELQHTAPVPADELGETVLFGPSIPLLDEMKGGIPTKLHGQIVFIVLAKQTLPRDLQQYEQPFFTVEFDEERKKNELQQFAWQHFDMEQTLDDLLLVNKIRGSTFAERHALLSAIQKVRSGRLEEYASEGTQFFTWNPDAVCNGSNAENRSQWLQREQGKSEADSREQVMMEFPLKFLRWNPDVDCDGQRAEDRSLRLHKERKSVAEAREQVMSEFPMKFGLEWYPDLDCDGARAEDRSLWLQREKGMKVEEARAQVIREFASKFAARKSMS